MTERPSTESQSHFRWLGASLLLQIRLTPRSSKDQVLGLMGDRLKISITAPPVDGKANAHLIKYLAKQFQVPRSQVTVISGDTTRDKTVQIDAPEDLPEAFGVVR
ncbi:MAG: DUF167 family protein [Planctomycetaceae bacterium]